MAFIKAKELKHRFIRRNEEGEQIGEIIALDGIDLEVEEGQFIAVLGHNGSGKSTFAKHLNVLLSPTEGSLWVDGRDVSQEEETWEIRQRAGMIFQNPDNQIVAGVVEEDVAFGPENIGVPTEEIWTRVAESLEAVGMTAYRYHSPNKLSGGQKQRVAIAGVVAMRPKCIIMDEPTAMLDPNGRQEVLKTVHRLNQEEGVTVILITHYMEEVTDADVVFVMDQGKIVMKGTPREVFAQVETLKQCSLDVPQITRLAYELKQEGYGLPDGILNRQELADYLCRFAAVKELMKEKPEWVQEDDASLTASGALPEQEIPEEAGVFSKEEPASHQNGNRKKMLSLDHVNYTYSAGTAYEIQALKDVSLDIYEGEFVGMIGHTGSGKSTLIQLLNGLLKTTSGKVYYQEQDIYGKDFSLRKLRGKVGLVFQYPEYQLFETTVLKDVAFGPKNMGLTEEEALERAKEALNLVQLTEEYWEMSPFELSGGQKRRAAIAGVIAMNPTVLILDEPTAGLDPKGRDELFALICGLHEQMNMTILLVSHSMEDVADYVDRIIVMRDGVVMLDGTPSQVFTHVKELEEASLAVPQVTYLMAELYRQNIPVSLSVTTIEEAKQEIYQWC